MCVQGLSGIEQILVNDLNDASKYASQGNWQGALQSAEQAFLLLLIESMLDSSSMGSGWGGSGYGDYANYGNYSGGNYSGGTVSGQPLTSGQKVQAKQIEQYLMSKYGLSAAQAAGVVGNMEVESSLNTGAYNSAEGAIGLCQWEGGRKAALYQFAASQGKPVTDWQVQVDFMMHEMKTTESGAYNALKSASDPTTAAAVFDADYERSAGTSRAQREADAREVYTLVA